MLDLTSVTDSARWTLGTRLAFRFAFCYFMTYALCSGIYTVWETIPWAGGYIEGCLAWPFLQAAQLLSPHIFHLHGNAQHRNVHRTVAHRVGSLSRKTNAPTNLRRPHHHRPLHLTLGGPQRACVEWDTPGRRCSL